jgi:histidine ammonia-lyase
MIEISPNLFNLELFEKIVLLDTKVKLSEDVVNQVKESNLFLNSFIKGKVIYGINTGLGPMAQYRIEEKDQVDLQKNLIRSHAAGIGAHQSPHMVKGAMLCRLISFSKAYSGVTLETLETLIAFINNNITPVVSAHGGVGASGDLVQLSQIALCLIGEGEVYYKGELLKTKLVLHKLDIKPLEIKLREGLALINGTSFMTSVSCINLISAKKALKSAILHGSLINELIESFDDHFSIELNQVKQHKHQQLIASQIREILHDSNLIQKRSDTYYNPKMEEKIFEKKVQEYYSLRCLPQILGPISKTISDAEEVIVDELNSVSDNPIIDIKSQNIYHGGNFHGDFVSCEMSKLKNAMIKLTVLTERQLNFLLNHKLNNIFTPFLNAGTLGLNLGLQGAQYAATSTTAENQSLSASVYVHSIPSNNDNQDLVSMGTNEALLTNKVIDNFLDVNSVFCLALFQASMLKNEDIKLSLATNRIFQN